MEVRGDHYPNGKPGFFHVQIYVKVYPRVFYDNLSVYHGIDQIPWWLIYIPEPSLKTSYEPVQSAL